MTFLFPFFVYRSDRINVGEGKLPLRAAFSVDDFHIDDHGWLLSPSLEYSQTQGNLKLTFAGGPIFADEAYHRYFYQVEPQYATTARPAYTVAVALSLEQIYGGRVRSLRHAIECGVYGQPVSRREPLPRRRFVYGLALLSVRDASS